MGIKVKDAKKRADGTVDTVRVKTLSKQAGNGQMSDWWTLSSPQERALAAVATAAYLKENNQFAYRQAATYARLYSNMPLFGVVGGALGRMSSLNQLPMDRPTMNVIQSCVDTLVSRLTQSRPRPVFLTDAGNYKERKLSKQLNQFVAGELYRTNAYELGKQALKDATAWAGTGVLHVYRGLDDKVAIERVLKTELLVDANDGLYGFPRQIHRLKLLDRQLVEARFPEYAKIVAAAEQAYPDNSADSTRTITDQIIVVESWRLASQKGAKDGRHIISCTAGSLLDEEYDKDTFPFAFLSFNDRPLGFWGQCLSEQLMGTQMEINKLLITISNSINLVGVPRVFVEENSKVNKAHLDNQIGAIITYRGTKPEYAIAPCVPQEVYAQLQRLVDYAYQQSGISALAAAAKKPEGLDSGKAIREYDDLQSDRFASLSKNYDEMFVKLAYLITDTARDIAKETGSYSSVYPSKDGTREVDLPASKMLDNTYIIQCFDSSSLPRDPAGRIQTAVEWLQAGAIDIKEFRRLAQFPDLEQMDKLESAGEERVFQVLDKMVEDGDYTPPDPFMPLELALKYSVAYYNLYVAAGLEEDKAEMIRTFNSQVKALQQASMPPAPMPMPGQAPQAVPQPLPQTPLLPQAA